jgi:tRNA nucleotidyltransferase (CCA-adding enzyme)
MVQKPFTDALPVLEVIESAGYEAFFVGGSVRDHILSRPIGDVDIATSARPDEVKKIFSRTVDIGIEHGTVLVLFKGRSYEVTTFRTESEYKDFRRPDEVKFVSSLHEDLKRRDFTMNAMAMDKGGKVIDPFGGRADIEKREIRTVGSPEERFGEDALRMMRAIRFVAQLNFSIEGHTQTSLMEMSHLLVHIAVERKKAEFEKLMSGQNRKEALYILVDSGIQDYLPGLKGKKQEILKFHSYKSEGLEVNEMWALLLFSLKIEEKEIEPFLREWKLPVKQMKEIIAMLKFMKLRQNRPWDVYSLYEAGSNIISSAERLVQAAGGFANQETLEKSISDFSKLPINSRDEMDVSGGEIIQWFGKSGGPWVKEKLALVERAILEGQIENKKEAIRKWLSQCNQK